MPWVCEAAVSPHGACAMCRSCDTLRSPTPVARSSPVPPFERLARGQKLSPLCGIPCGQRAPRRLVAESPMLVGEEAGMAPQHLILTNAKSLAGAAARQRLRCPPALRQAGAACCQATSIRIDDRVHSSARLAFVVARHALALNPRPQVPPTAFL